MSWSRNRLLVVSVALFLASVAVTTVVAGYAALVFLAALDAGTPVAGALLNLAVPYVPILAVSLAIAVCSAVGIAWGLVRKASVPRSERLHSAVDRAERKYSPVGSIGLADLFAPPEPSDEEAAENALAELKRRYVAGDIDEREFERKVDRLVSNESIDEARAEREVREAELEQR